MPPECNSSLSIDDRNRLLWIHGGTAVISSTVCIIAVSTALFLKLYKYFSYRLAIYQVLSSLFFSMAEILTLSLLNYNGDEYYQIACKVDAFLAEYTVWVKLLFTLCVSFHFFCLTVCLRNFENFEAAYILISVLLPLLFTWIPFIDDLYGLAGAWCWIKVWKDNCASHHSLEGTIEQFTLWYGPLFVSLTVVLVGFLIIPVSLAWRKSQRKTNSENERLLMKEKDLEIKEAIKRLLPLLAYPAIFYVLALFPLINRIYSAVSNYASYDLAVAHASTQSSWSFFSGLALIIHMLLIRKMIMRKQPTQQLSDSSVKYQDNFIFTSTASTVHIHAKESDTENGFEN